MREGTKATPPIAFGPARTLTFLFADLRDYTRFVETRGDQAAKELIAEYRRIVRSAVEGTGGGEIKTEGDSFYVVFETARQAVQCGVAIQQQAERSTRERADRPIRVGTGIHAGEPVPHEGQFVGSAVNVAARLCSAASPGEIVVSDLVRGLLRTSGGFDMQEKHGVTLKGIDEPIRAYTVVWRPLPTGTPERTDARDVAVAANAPADKRVLCPIVVGRDAELAQLDALLEEVARGETRTALVSGEAGIGKSTFVRAFRERAAGRGARVLIGECIEAESRRPFGPFVDAVRVAFRELSAAAVEASLRENATELLALFPEAGAAAAQARPTEDERYRVHAAFVRLFADLAQRAPLVVTIEDLHWADEASLELLPYLVRKLRGAQVLLLGTYRSDELHRTHPLRPMLAELARTRQVREVALHRLTVEETGTLIQAALALARAPTAEFRALMHERCEGNPFFLEEVLRALVERGDLEYRDGAWRRTKEVAALAIPDSVRDAVQERVAELDEEEREVLQYAAVIGQRFEFELLERVTRVPERTLVEALHAAIGAQLVAVERADGAESYAFRHALTRESVLAELLQRERRSMHRAVAEATLELARGDTAHQAEELAYHFDEAGDVERAREYHVLAAREAHRVYAHRRVVRHLERAVELSPEGVELAQLELELSEAAQYAGDVQRSRRAAERAGATFARAGDRLRQARAIQRQIGAMYQLGERAAAQQLADEVVRMLEPLGPTAELAHAYGRVARHAMIDARNAEAIEVGRRAIGIARDVGDRDGLVYSLSTVGSSLVTLGDRHGLDLMYEALALAKDAASIEQVQVMLNNLVYTHFRIGEAADARRAYAEAVEHARTHNYAAPALAQWSFWFPFVDGDWDTALRVLDALTDDNVYGISMRLWGTTLHASREGPDAWLPRADAISRQLLAVGGAQWTGSAALAAATAFVAGDMPRVLEYAELAADSVAEDRPHPPVSAAAMMALEAARRLGDGAAFERWLALCLTEKVPIRAGIGEARRELARAERAARAGDVDGAIERFASGAQLLGEYPPVNHTIARLRLAEMLLTRGASGDRERARDEVAKAMDIWRRGKAVWYLERLKEWASERGVASA